MNSGATVFDELRGYGVPLKQVTKSAATVFN
jgi:hypothetical protein